VRHDITVDIGDGSEVVSIVDPARLEQALGLKTTLSTVKKQDGLRALYRAAGVDLDDIADLIKVMKNIEGINDPATFVKRRATLAGLSGITGAVGLGALTSVETGGLALVAMAIFGRHVSKVFARPERLKLMRTALDDAADASVRRSAIGRLIKVLAEDDEIEPNEPTRTRATR
jgi:hypothetical protein